MHPINELLYFGNYGSSAYGHKTWNLGSFSLENEIVFNDVIISNKELEILYRNSNLISTIVNYYPDEAVHYGYNLYKNQKVVVEADKYLLNIFREASIKARLYGKAFLVFNPDTGYPYTENFQDHDYKIYLDLTKGKDGWINKRHKIVELNDDFIKNVSYITKKYPEENVFCFFGKINFSDDVEVDEPNYSSSVINGFFTEYKNFIVSNEFARKILQNLSNLIISVKGLGLQTNSKDAEDVIEKTLHWLDRNRATSNAILYDASGEVATISQSLENVSDFLDSLKNILASATDVPTEILFGYEKGSGYWTHLVVRQLWAEKIQNWVINNWTTNLSKIYLNLDIEFDKIEIPNKIVLTDLEKAEMEEVSSRRTKNLVESNVITPEEAKSGYDNSDFSLHYKIK